jgi:hypothetical protein
MSTGLFSDEEEEYNIEEETKYKLKLPNTDTKSDLSDEEIDIDLDSEDFDIEDSDDKPFDDEPFDAGVEADEDEDPEKFIQQLAGKLGTTLRSYSKERGEPDFPLEKFAINSVISATHTAEMDKSDQKDIIKKIKSSGLGGSEDESESDDEDIDIDLEDETLDESMFEPDKNFENDENFKNDENMWEEEELEIYDRPEIENEMFFSDLFNIFDMTSKIIELGDNIKKEDWVLDHLTSAKTNIQSIFSKLKSKFELDENIDDNGMLSQNLKTIQKLTFDILNMDIEYVDDTICQHNEWMNNLLAKSTTHINDVYNFITDNDSEDSIELKTSVKVSDDLKYHIDNNLPINESVFRYGSEKHIKLLKEVKKLYNYDLIKLNEKDKYIIENFSGELIKENDELIPLNFILENDKFKGKDTNSPSRDSSGGKAYKVYVPGCSPKTETNPRGIKLIRFGSGGLKAKLSDKEARKNYDSRHGCSDGKHNDKCKAGYWSCRLPSYAEKLGISNASGKWW